ncbi:hypothetical protein AXF42_Ash011798 [Apostasia shenzhenica]|uniref:Uncharacterized protein n=1 Tax=Apostasia shenzhenica TaxID=1088818 RepID=A0A2I0AVU7_9ASPA|nr:hypothetical protein AXF42_Ash011798 [Apostasia shenzhenica]
MSACGTAVFCAERGIRPHLLLRGEQPRIPTGYNLVSLMYGNVKYVARSEYAHRREILIEHARSVAGCDGSVVSVNEIFDVDSILYENRTTCPQSGACQGSRRVIVMNEGAGDAVALLGLIRLVNYLSTAQVFGMQQQIKLVLDAGTGTTAVGLALGAVCLGHINRTGKDVCHRHAANNLIVLLDTVEDRANFLIESCSLQLCRGRILLHRSPAHPMWPR